MSVTLDDVRHVASLARLSFSPAEMQKLTGELNSILEYMRHLESIDAQGLEPLSHVIELHNVFRKDEPGLSLSAEEALQNAPAATDTFFRVPKVISER